MREDFSELAIAYDTARHGYPEEVINYIISLTNASHILLDAGCGTGIATRQLAEKIKDVYGLDINKKMIETAEKHGQFKIKYFVAPANKMPFDSGMFDITTAFSAFHWFYDNDSVKEIKRVLKKNGLLVVANKNDIGDFRNYYENLIENLTGERPRDMKIGYNPFNVLKNNGFLKVKENKFKIVEQSPMERALLQVQSMSLWNLIPNSLRQQALDTFKKHFLDISKNNIVERELEITLISGEK